MDGGYSIAINSGPLLPFTVPSSFDTQEQGEEALSAAALRWAKSQTNATIPA